MASKSKKSLPIVTHAVVLRSNRIASEFGEVLWAVLGEVASFFNLDKTRGDFQRRWIGNTPPPTAAQSDHLVKLDDNWWNAIRRDEGRLVDYKLIDSAVHELLPNEDHLLIVTDRELTPPKNWRYVIWWDVSVTGDGVVSLAPLDPEYWGDNDPARLETVKWRIRAALMCMTGLRLGFRRCNNTRCYMYANIDSVTVLDSMTTLGDEHKAEGLTDRVFTGEVDDVLGLEAIIAVPKASSEL